jgi:PEP-CTERM motif
MNFSSAPKAVSAALYKANQGFRWNIIALALVGVSAIAVTPAAHADSYAFSFSGGGMSGSGEITYSPTAVPGVPGAYQVTGISGSFSDTNAGVSNAAITGIQSTSLPTVNPDGTFLPPGGDSAGLPYSFSNLFYPGGNSPAVCPPPAPGDPEPPYPFGGGYFDIYGLYFNVAGGYSVDLWSNGVVPGFGLTYGVGDAHNGTGLNTYGEPFSGTSVNVSVAPTPEPGTLLLLGTGMIGFAGSLSRRLRKRA